jgi:hypothetical protein
MAQPNEKTPANAVEGEGSYTGTRRYNEHLAQHRREADVDKLAEQAREAVEGDDAEELKRAEEAARRGPKP